MCRFARFAFCLIAILACHKALPAAEPTWKEVVATDDWKKAPAGDKGRLWYRAKITVPATWQGRNIELVVESIDDAREIYLGGNSPSWPTS